jgi:hypothetical protein
MISALIRTPRVGSFHDHPTDADTHRDARRALLVPGILQTYEVIRAIMVAAGVPETEIDERVNDRLGRRHLITRRGPAHLTVLLGEAAIRQNIGGRPIMADQLRYLLELEKFPNVELLAVPFSANWTPALTGSYMLA